MRVARNIFFYGEIGPAVGILKKFRADIMFFHTSFSLEQRMIKKYSGLCFLIILLILSCDIFEPPVEDGTLLIRLDREQERAGLAKPQQSLSSVQCVVSMGGESVYDGHLAKSGNLFRGEIKNLKPGSGYAVLLYGKNSDASIIKRGFKDGITITAGKASAVTIKWTTFTTTLSSPTNGSTISDQTPAFKWSSVSGAASYQLVVDNSSDFSSPAIDQSNLTSSSYTSSSLSDGTYYWRVRAKDNNGNWSDWSSVWNFTISSYQTGTVTDIDGNVYKTVKIGDQWWVAENLKVTHYRNGDPIPNVTGSSEWANLSTGATCNYDNNESYVSTYGRLYNWYAVNDSRGLAPAGWHVPTDAEWKQLEMYLGMSQSEADATGWRGTDEGGKLKETGTGHWASPNTGATNESGFSALPGGYRFGGGTFYGIGFAAYFWSASSGSDDRAWYRSLSCSNSAVYRFGYSRRGGFSVRVVRD
ncbi:fibrobacter succinogenes major paralogous domain-containing protein [candidate division KSB1 bacterium]|nr:fibrobacter succinogenes major paralogous domain-containing protein [candidate division KSB1 bacterium]